MGIMQQVIYLAVRPHRSFSQMGKPQLLAQRHHTGRTSKPTSNTYVIHKLHQLDAKNRVINPLVQNVRHTIISGTIFSFIAKELAQNNWQLYNKNVQNLYLWISRCRTRHCDWKLLICIETKLISLFIKGDKICINEYKYHFGRAPHLKLKNAYVICSMLSPGEASMQMSVDHRKLPGL